MEFCPKCGGILTTARRAGEIVMLCRKCNYYRQVSEQVVIAKTANKRGRRVVTVIEGDESDIHPKTTDVQCPSCGNREAYWWSVQTRSADEPMTQFFRCTKCGNTWREYA